MSFSFCRTIRALVAPQHRASMSGSRFERLRHGLELRANHVQESGAFLLGNAIDGHREIQGFVFYDELDPHAYDNGAILLDSSAYVPLFALCHKSGLSVLGDVHVHPGKGPRACAQSCIDKANPMMSNVGHIAIILNDYASPACSRGVHEYLGRGHWAECDAAFFYVGTFGP